ncbi:MAG: HEAT repeat domain-containing protein [Planctomycetota bacterium]|jgi:HEAT repeat protein
MTSRRRFITLLCTLTVVLLQAVSLRADESLLGTTPEGQSIETSVDGVPAVPPAATPHTQWLSRWVLWPLGVIEFWLVGSLATWSVLLWLAPARIRQIDERLSSLRIGDWQLADGTQVTLAHVLLVRAFVSNTRVLDAWLESRCDVLCEWHAIEVDDAEAVTLEVRGSQITLDDGVEMRRHVPEDRACLALYGESRRWDAKVLHGLLRLSLHPRPESRLADHPLLSVVLDRKCLERLHRSEQTSSDGRKSPTLQDLVRSELHRIEAIASDLTDEWLTLLQEKHRLLVVVEDWHRTPVQVRTLVSQAYENGEFSHLIIVSGGTSIPSLPGLVPLNAPDTATASRSETSESVDAEKQPEEVPALSVHIGGDDPAEEPATADEEQALVNVAVGQEDESPGTDAAVSDVAAEVDRAEDVSDPVLVQFPESSDAGTTDDLSGETADIADAAEAADEQPATVTHPPAGEMLTRLGDAAKSVIPTLGQALDSSNASLRQQAVDQLSELVLTILPRLETSLSDGDAAIRCSTVHTLARIEELMQSAIAHAMNDPDASVRREAVAALPTREEQTLEPLAAALEDAHPETRQHAARALGAMGSLAAPTVPALIELLGAEQAACRSEAAIALGRIGTAAVAACPSLTQTLLEDSRTVRASAAQALCRIGHIDAQVLSALCEAAEDSDATVREHSVVALGQLGPGNGDALAAVRGALSDETPAIRAAACRALSEFGPAAKEAIADLDVLLTDRSVHVRRAVVESVAQIDLASVPVLRKALDDADPQVRRSAATALSGIGLAVMPRLLERDDAEEILASLGTHDDQSDEASSDEAGELAAEASLAEYEERSA